MVFQIARPAADRKKRPRWSARSSRSRQGPHRRPGGESKRAARNVVSKRTAKAQPNAAKSKLRNFVSPSLATLSDKAPSGCSNWLHEIKFDGYRMEARLEHGKVRLLTRRRQHWTHRAPPVADAVAALPATTALLDGEVVVEDDNGISNFSLLQTDLKDGRTDRFVCTSSTCYTSMAAI